MTDRVPNFVLFRQKKDTQNGLLARLWLDAGILHRVFLRTPAVRKKNVLHLAYGKFGGGPVAAVFVIVLFAVAALFLRYVRFGRYIYAVGDDHHGARLMGLPCSRVGGVA